MKVASIDVPEPVEKAAAAAGIHINTAMTKEDERVLKVATDNFATLRKSPQPIDSTMAANQAVRQAIKQVVPSAPEPDPDAEVLAPVDTYDSGWECLEQILSSLRNDPASKDQRSRC